MDFSFSKDTFADLFESPEPRLLNAIYDVITERTALYDQLNSAMKITNGLTATIVEKEAKMADLETDLTTYRRLTAQNSI